MQIVQRDRSRHWTVSWPALLGGAVSGLGVLVLLGSFWTALAGEWTFLADNFQWFQMASAFVAWFVAGVVAGWFAGPEVGRGASHGFMVWGLILVVRSFVAIPAALAPISFAIASGGNDPAWAVFAATAGSLVAAVAGGVVGGGASAVRDDGEDRRSTAVAGDLSDGAPGRREPVQVG